MKDEEDDMTEMGVVVAVFRGNEVLLTKREDFDVWCLPGGAIDPHETMSNAARREVFEETGIQVELTHHVGLLSRPNWGQSGVHLSVFGALPLSETFDADPNEVTELAYFPVDKLPVPLLWDAHPLIAAALTGTTGHLWVNHARTPPYFADRRELYAWRDRSGLSRRDAYYRLMDDIGPQSIELVLGPSG